MENVSNMNKKIHIPVLLKFCASTFIAKTGLRSNRNDRMQVIY